jgi:hypothetical protein
MRNKSNRHSDLSRHHHCLHGLHTPHPCIPRYQLQDRTLQLFQIRGVPGSNHNSEVMVDNIRKSIFVATIQITELYRVVINVFPFL